MSGPQCRLCLAIIEDSDCSVLEDMFRQAIERVFTFEIPCTEGLPTSVCRECSTYVWDFNVYSEKVEHNQQFLLTWCPAENVNTVCKQEEHVANHELATTLVSTVLIPDSDDDVDAIYDYAVKPEEVTDTHDEEEWEHDQQLDGGMGCEELGAVLSNDSDVEEAVRETVVVALANDESSGQETDTHEPDQERRTYCTRSGQLPWNRKPGGTYRCGTCDKSFKLKRDLKHHTQMKHPVRRVAKHGCAQCEKTFRTKMELRDHKRLHRRKKCPKCGKMIVSRNIKVHIATHDGTFLCDVCDRCFSTPQSRKKHRRQAHLPAGALKTEQCVQCGQAFYTKFQLATHQRTHVRVQCDVCGGTYASKTSLKRHMLVLHSRLEPTANAPAFPCHHCEKTFHSRTQLTRHLYWTMKQECPVCNEMVTRIRLKDHMTTSHGNACTSIPNFDASSSQGSTEDIIHIE